MAQINTDFFATEENVIERMMDDRRMTGGRLKRSLGMACYRLWRRRMTSDEYNLTGIAVLGIV